ncbi:hypothetical protein C1H57_15155 [Clostridium sp. 2-1]|uniref:DUF2971 domain-containing protein n=1 Tax=Clostridium TaxID=1485 RepID=UPI000CDB96AE|nr:MULTISPECIES: DUF2971 domain-containing protein [Clostridium]MBN7576342.1 DUF2971 domain-containing protein [Clostridium beijerinckii]MBN7580196.1 DUF2971 domain-containing protein [Clostridium beijerinckii]MBN7586099.1 DUF2971 domain-containing protein [Clostridium beijerinckii]MBO0522147.1 DUF2971 domain-containing protein [Clostridium beijerinckii]NOW82956.1 hypothetical protein [Clostridium beijerinckii]
MARLESIYHYCSADTFMSIIQNKTLRLSDLNKTNDYMEKRWANKFIVSLLQEKLNEYGIDMKLEEDYWYDEESNSHLQYYKKEVERVLYDESPVLITCFSEGKDILSQWRAYGQDGTGVTIGFNYKVINLLNDKKDMVVKNVIYKENKQKEKLGQLIESVIIYIQNMFEEDNVRISDDFNVYFKEEFDAFCEVLVDYIGEISCIIKNPAFSEEKEVRIIYNPKLPNREILGDIQLNEAKDYFEKIKEIDEYKIKPLKFNYRNNQLVAYCDIDFSGLIDKPIINEITIGPKSQLKESDIYYFLLANGFDANNISITKSEATYR